MGAGWLGIVLVWSTRLVVIFALCWLGSWLYDRARRRALNLTRAETVERPGARPDFLSVDHAGRARALEAGTAFEDQRAQAPAPGPDRPVSRTTRLARIAAVGMAVLSLITGVLGALMRIRVYDEVARDFGVWDRAVAIVSQHPIGFAVALGVIAVVARNFILSVRSAA